MSKYISPWHLLLLCSIFALMHWRYLHGNSQRGRPTTGSRTAYCPSPTGAVAVQLTQPATASFPPWFACWLAMEDVAVNRLATSITQLTLCQVTTDEIDAATKLLDKACQKLRGIPDVPPQRIADLETAIRQLLRRYTHSSPESQYFLRLELDSMSSPCPQCQCWHRYKQLCLNQQAEKTGGVIPRGVHMLQPI